MKPLSLSDRQLRLVQTAAKAVPVSRRDEFLQKLAAHLTSEPSDAAVQAATQRANGADRASRSHHFSNFGKETNK
jgi:hypothetical protein